MKLTSVYIVLSIALCQILCRSYHCAKSNGIHDSVEADVRKRIIYVAETKGINIRSVYLILTSYLYLKKLSGR